jgi:hypothetical protein
LLRKKSYLRKYIHVLLVIWPFNVDRVVEGGDGEEDGEDGEDVEGRMVTKGSKDSCQQVRVPP